MRTLKGLTVPPGTEWEELLTLFLTLDNHKIMPDAEWYNEVLEKITLIGKEEYIDHVVTWARNKMIDHDAYKDRMDVYWNKRFAGQHAYDIVSHETLEQQDVTPAWVNQVYNLNYHYDPDVNPLYTRTGYYFYYTLGGRLLRGILHTAALFPNSELMTMADAFGINNLDECMDVIHVYKSLPHDVAMSRILRILNKVKNKSIRKKIEKVIASLGKDVNMSSDQLKETLVPDFGLNAQHRLLVNAGSYTIGLDLLNHKPAEIIWWENGQQLAKVPASAKKEADAAIKKLKADGKKLAEQCNIHKNRIEEFYRHKRSWLFNEWLPLYIHHPLTGALGKRLIWQFTKDDQQRVAIWTQEGFRTASGEILSWPDKQTLVELWHPIYADAAHVLQWRSYLTGNEIQQPFKQAFREVYLLTAAEEATATFSNRFANHILTCDQFAMLCKVRGWTPGDMKYNGPSIKLPEWELRATLAIQGIYLGVVSHMRGSAHVTTGAITFLGKKTATPLTEVPPLVFSEIMRDVDMFVGVTSIGNDPAWYERDTDEGREYWNSYAFGELSVTAKTREEVLKDLIPKLPFADKCRFEGKFLVVTGSLKTYKIHMGSGNILMAPNDRYLCIVVSGKDPSDKVFLPFEGDYMLSVIISKAILLANDKKITDDSILSQINRD